MHVYWWCSRDVLFAGHYGYYAEPPCNIYSYVRQFRVAVVFFSLYAPYLNIYVIVHHYVYVFHLALAIRYLYDTNTPKIKLIAGL